ncbi:TetR/AcrR family transcriptional regulator [Nocardia sp. NPDC055321]
MAKRATVEKRPRRERGSLNPGDILDGAFDLAGQVGIDKLSMPMLGKHLDVGVTSIYWYFRKKDDLLNAMTDSALSTHAEELFAANRIRSGNWRAALGEHARTMRDVFRANPILCDLVLIRSSLSSEAALLGAQATERVIAELVAAGFTSDGAVDTYSAIQLHVHGSVVLQRLRDRSPEADAEPRAYYEQLTITPGDTPLLAEAEERGLHSGMPDDHNFEFGLDCILEQAERSLTAGAPARKPAKAASSSRARQSSPHTRATKKAVSAT